ncbi:hypothetical protein O6H91_09G045600 [Diphasiastrum complanatum]|nr:hypothetical protein O6H91_09G045600 [Diphasiastrum complanatum]
MKSIHWNAFRSTDRGVLDVVSDERHESPKFFSSSTSSSMDFSCYEGYDEADVANNQPGMPWYRPPGDTKVGKSSLGWPLGSREKIQSPAPLYTPRRLAGGKNSYIQEEKRDKRETEASEVEMMKERFSRLLLGEDMSGGGKGVCTALAISNAITNLSASVFGELYRLEPLAPKRKNMWQREMEWLLSVTDHIVELVPTWQSFPDGSSLEVMLSAPRSDLHINLPALRKLDNMLLESLDSFTETEFWYVDQGVAVSNTDDRSYSRDSLPRQEEKWWLPVIKVPAAGLSDESRKHLQHQRESLSQVLKAAMAINAQVLLEIEVPDAYWEAIPKNGKASLGEALYRNLILEPFSPDTILSSFDLSTEHSVLEVANRIEAAIQVWNRKIYCKQTNTVPKESRFNSKSWGLMKDLVADMEKREVLVSRAETLLLTLRQKFPGLPQTLLDMNKIQFNKDVGQAILESYSRVLESLAHNIISRIDDVVHIDGTTKTLPSASPKYDSSGRTSSSRQNNPLLLDAFSTRLDLNETVAPAMVKSKSSRLSIISQLDTDISSSPGKTLADYMKLDPLNKDSSVEEVAGVRGKPLSVEVNNRWSYAQNLEHAKIPHSPPGRD